MGGLMTKEEALIRIEELEEQLEDSRNALDDAEGYESRYYELVDSLKRLTRDCD
jgi:hypothetical protein